MPQFLRDEDGQSQGSNKFSREGFNFRRDNMVIHRASGGNHNVSPEGIPIYREADVDLMFEDAIMGNLQIDESDPKALVESGFSRYMKEHSNQRFAMNQSFREENSDIEDHYNMSLDEKNEGEAPSSGHNPKVPATMNAFSSKKRVYIASLDKIATIYERQGSTLTVKTADGKWLDISMNECEPIKTAAETSPNTGKEEFGTGYNNPTRRENPEQEGFPSKVRDQSEETMSHFSSYSEKRRRG